MLPHRPPFRGEQPVAHQHRGVARPAQRQGPLGAPRVHRHAGQPAHDPRGKRGAAESVQLVLGQVEGGLEGAGVEGEGVGGGAGGEGGEVAGREEGEVGGGGGGGGGCCCFVWWRWC